MSRHCKPSRAKSRRAPPARSPSRNPSSVARLLSAADGYANALASLGENSPLLSSGTFFRNGLTANTELLTTAYRTNWIVKRIIDMPAEDMTRAWYRLSADLPDEALSRLKRLEARHSVRQELANAIRWARLYGGAIALIVIRGEEDLLDQPLDPDSHLPDSFQGLLVLDRAQGIAPSAELVTDLDDSDFGLPAYYEAELTLPTVRTVRIHHSRVLRFVGRELPFRETEAENGWGASELEHICPGV